MTFACRRSLPLSPLKVFFNDMWRPHPFFVSNFCCTRHSLWSFLGVAFVHRFKYKKDSHLRNSLLFIVSNPPSHCSLKSSLAFYMDSTTMWKPLHFQKIALNSWYFHTQKKQFQHGITVLPSEGLEISLNWWCGLKIKTNFLLIRSIDRATQSVKSLFQKWFKDGCTQIIEDRSQIKWWMRWCAWGSAARMSRWTHRRAHARTYVNARHLSALLFLRVPLAINDLFLQAEQKYDCLWLKYWWLCMNY